MYRDYFKTVCHCEKGEARRGNLLLQKDCFVTSFLAMTRVLSVLILVVAISGCASKKVTVRGYMDDKYRVDQDVPDEAVGNWQGAPNASKTAKKQTRKVYVLEVTKALPEIPEDKAASNSDMTSSTSLTDDLPSETHQMRAQPRISLPSFDDAETSSASTSDDSTILGEAQEYTVQKDDTLQKIAKKFYGAYSKWPKIYEANKDKIKSPDFLPQGIVITIPAE